MTGEEGTCLVGNNLCEGINFVACWQWITRLTVIQIDGEQKNSPEAVTKRGIFLGATAAAIRVERYMVWVDGVGNSAWMGQLTPTAVGEGENQPVYLL